MSSFMGGRYTLDSVSLADLSPSQTRWLGHGRGRSPMALPPSGRQARSLAAVPPLCTLLRGETVWKLRIGSITGSHEPAERGKRAPFRAPRATEKRAIRPA